MNTAIWMLYFADVAESINGVLIGVTVACVIALAIWWFARSLHNMDLYGNQKAMPVPPRWIYLTALGCALVASVIPSKNTFYAIAAANVGEKALHTQTGDKAVRALNAWLDRQIADDGKAK